MSAVAFTADGKCLFSGSDHDNGLLWFNDHILVLSESNIIQIDASTGSTLSEWPVVDNYSRSCIALSKLGKVIAHSTRNTVTLWDTSTHIQLDTIQGTRDIYSIAVSPDDHFLAIGGKENKIIISSLTRINVST